MPSWGKEADRLTVLLKGGPVREDGSLRDFAYPVKTGDWANLAGDDVDPLAIDGGTQNLAAGVNDSLFDALAGFGLD